MLTTMLSSPGDEANAETLEGDLAEKEADTEVEAMAPGVEETVVPPEIGNLAAPPERPMSARISEPNRSRFQRPQRQGGGRRRGHRNFRSHDRSQGQQRRPQLISEMRQGRPGNPGANRQGASGQKGRAHH